MDIVCHNGAVSVAHRIFWKSSNLYRPSVAYRTLAKISHRLYLKSLATHSFRSSVV